MEETYNGAVFEFSKLLKSGDEVLIDKETIYGYASNHGDKLITFYLDSEIITMNHPASYLFQGKRYATFKIKSKNKLFLNITNENTNGFIIYYHRRKSKGAQIQSKFMCDLVKVMFHASRQKKIVFTMDYISSDKSALSFRLKLKKRTEG